MRIKMNDGEDKKEKGRSKSIREKIKKKIWSNTAMRKM
jgi:hypothetical protein